MRGRVRACHPPGMEGLAGASGAGFWVRMSPPLLWGKGESFLPEIEFCLSLSISAGSSCAGAPVGAE